MLLPLKGAKLKMLRAAHRHDECTETARKTRLPTARTNLQDSLLSSKDRARSSISRHAFHWLPRKDRHFHEIQYSHEIASTPPELHTEAPKHRIELVSNETIRRTGNVLYWPGFSA